MTTNIMLIASSDVLQRGSDHNLLTDPDNQDENKIGHEYETLSQQKNSLLTPASQKHVSNEPLAFPPQKQLKASRTSQVEAAFELVQTDDKPRKKTLTILVGVFLALLCAVVIGVVVYFVCFSKDSQPRKSRMPHTKQLILLDTLTPIEFSLIFTMPQDQIKPIMLDGSNNGTTVQAAIGSQFFIKIPQTANQQLVIDNSTLNDSFNYTGRFLSVPSTNAGFMIYSFYTLRASNSAFRIANPGSKGFSGSWESFQGEKWVFFVECTAAAPDAPVQLKNNPAVTSSSQVGISWMDGDYDGGKPVLDYAVYFDNATFNTSILLANLTLRSYTARGLVIGNTYKFWVTSRNVMNNSLPSDPVSILAASLPDPPIDLQDNPAITSDIQVGLTWSPGQSNGGSPVIDYRVSQNGQVLASGVTNLFFTAVGLKSGTTYTYTVSARTLVGYSPPSNIATVLAARPPDSSIQLYNNAALTTQTQIGLRWNSPAYNGGSPVIDYQLFQATGNQPFTSVANVTLTSFVVTGLTGGDTYHFRVQARNVKGSSSQTPQISVLCASAPLTPQAPTTQVSSGNVGIYWKTPNSGGSPITAYKIEIKISDGTFITDLTQCNGGTSDVVSSLNCIIPISRLRGPPYNLAWGSTIYAKVSAINIVGTSQSSPVGGNAQILTLPDAPTNITKVFTSGPRWIDLKWSDGASNGGTQIIDYLVMSQGAPVLTANVTNLTVPGLEPGQMYQFVIKARNSQGYSQNSTVATFTTPADVPDAPLNLRSVPAFSSRSQIGLQWSPGKSSNGSPLIDYSLSFDNATGNFVPAAQNITSPDLVIVSNLVAGQNYTFKVSARNAVGSSANSTAITVWCVGISDPPVLTFDPSLNTGTSVSINWADGVSNGGVPILDYRVSSAEQPTQNYVVLQTGVTTKSFNATGLILGKTYSFKIESRNQMGYSLPSNPISVLSALLPDAPANLVNVAAITTAGQIGLQWSPGAQSLGTPLIDYTISYDQSIGVYQNLVSGLNSTNYTAFNLTSGKTYSFKVQARNAVGFSAYSSVTTIVCPSIPDSPILSFNSSQTTDTSISLTWTDGRFDGGLAVIDYRVSSDQATGSYVVLQTGVTTQSYTVTNLTPGKQYSFKIESRNSLGYSAPSNKISAGTAIRPDAPVNVVNVVAITSVSQAGLQWSAGASSGSQPVIDYTVSYDQSTGVWVTLASGLTSTNFTAQGLAAGKSYSFRVQARSAVGLSDYSTVTTIVCAVLPDAPVLASNQTQADSDTQIALTWLDGASTGGLPIIDYRVSYSEASGSQLVLGTGVTSQGYLATGLKPGTNYSFKIQSRNQIGYSPFSNEIRIVTALRPDAPINLANAPLITSGSQAGLQWSPGVSSGSSALLDYSISYDQSTGVYVTLVSGLNATSYTATGMVAGKTYSFKVNARNAVGLSADSNVVSILCVGVPDAPVLDFDEVLTTDKQIFLTWVDGASTGGLPIIDYRISSNQATGSFVVLASGVTAKSYIVTDIVPKQNYGFKVEARNQMGYSPMSNVALVLSPMRPDAPVSLANVAAITDENKIGISWSPGASYGSRPIIDYSISYDQSTGVYVTLASGLKSTNYTATGLKAGKTYSFKVSARNVVGPSDYSSVVAILCASIPNAPVLSQDASQTTTTQIALTWVNGSSAGGVPIIDYRISYDQSTGNFVVLKSGVSGQSFIATGLQTGLTYSFKIEARNQVGYSLFSNQIAAVAAMKPDTPLNILNVPAITSGSQIGIQWSPGASNGGSSVIDYTVSYDQSTGVWVTLASNVTATAYTAQGLIGGKTYSFRVVARNAIGSSAFSAVAAVLCAAVPDVPILNFDPTQITDTQIALTWVDGASSQGMPIIDYRVSSDQATGSYVVLQTGVKTQSYTVTNLTPGKQYSFKIESRNSLGYSAPSNRITVGTAVRPDTPVNVVNVAAITSESQIGLQWSAGTSSGSQPVIDYTISYDQSTGKWVTLASGLTSTNFTAKGLAAGKSYSFRVQARSAVGLSDYSTVTTILCASIPNAPVLSYDLSSTTTTQIALTWVDGSSTGGLPIIDYRISYDQSTGNFVVLKSGVSGQSFIATGLQTGLTYSFKIEARNQVGYSLFSNQIAAVAAMKPDTPLNILNVPAITSGSQIGIQWSPGASNGGSSVIDYTVSYDQSTGVWVTLASNVTATAYTAQGLIGGKTYSFRVVARNAIGSSAFSAVAAVLCAAVPDVPILNFDPTQITDTQIALTWVDGASSQGMPIIDYRVSFDQATGSFVVLQTGVTTQSFIATGLTPGQSYSFKVESRNSLGYSAQSNKMTVATGVRPDAPLNLANVASITTLNRLGLKWSPGASSGSSPVIDYTISYDQATDVWVTLASNITSTSYTAIGLQGGKTYSFKVQARSAVGLSELSAAVSIVQLGLPGAPFLSYNATLTNEKTVALSWTDSPNTGGLPILDYRITYDNATAMASFMVLKTTVTSKSYNVLGVRPGLTYAFKIEARNVLGYSQFSNIVAPTTVTYNANANVQIDTSTVQTFVNYVTAPNQVIAKPLLSVYYSGKSISTTVGGQIFFKFNMTETSQLVVDKTVINGGYTWVTNYQTYANLQPYIPNMPDGPGGVRMFQLDGVSAGTYKFRVASVIPGVSAYSSWDSYTGDKWTFTIVISAR